ncbi:MAG: methyl-accepting chemotaxis protein [Actinomycetota bacterium]|nr:methyl-accepting chemotaxis protein [Actinomycetota bacterium]
MGSETEFQAICDADTTTSPEAHVRWFTHRSLFVKIAAAVGVIAIVAVGVGFTGVTRLGAMAAETSDLYEDEYVQTGALTALQREMLQVRLDIVNHGGSSSDASFERYEQLLAEDLARFAELRTETDTFELAPETEATLAEVFASWDEFLPYLDRMIEAARDGGGVEWTLIRNEAAQYSEAATTALQEVVDLVGADAERVAEHAQSTATESRVITLVVLGGGLAAGFAVALAVSRNIVGAVGRLADALDRSADGDLTAEVDTDAGGEVGRMAASLQTMLHRTSEAMSSIAENATRLAASSEELSTTSQHVGAAAEETSTQAANVSSSAEEVSTSVSSVATGTEEMSASIREIAQSTSEASRVASEALSTANDANATVTRLGESSNAIGEVVAVITSIAEQTNLLALNATIEAARAGDAGKGFAVVANEVKDLAQETAKATEEIAQRVQGIQGDTGAAVTAIAGISEVIGRINDLQSTVAGAVEEQSATTDEISRTVADAAGGAGEIARNIGEVATASNDASHGAADSLTASQDLARMASDLQQLISRFRFEPAAA